VAKIGTSGKGRGNIEGLATHLSHKFGGDPSFFTKCMADEQLQGYDTDARSGICAKAHKLAVGKWPTEGENIERKGGEGSGNFGHAGVPGHIGGSATSGGVGGIIGAGKAIDATSKILVGKGYGNISVENGETSFSVIAKVSGINSKRRVEVRFEKSGKSIGEGSVMLYNKNNVMIKTFTGNPYDLIPSWQSAKSMITDSEGEKKEMAKLTFIFHTELPKPPKGKRGTTLIVKKVIP